MRSEFYCCNCGQKSGLPVYRKASRLKEKGHLKKLYCLHCRQEVAHYEVREFDYDGAEVFKEKYENGDFREVVQQLWEKQKSWS